jgi:3-dehydroquinate dehydratase-1
MIAMGRLGRHLRAVAPIYGSALTYGFVTESTAPGQMSLHELCLARKMFEIEANF